MCTNCDEIKVELNNQIEELEEEIKDYAKLLDDENMKLLEQCETLLKLDFFIQACNNKSDILHSALNSFRIQLINQLTEHSPKYLKQTKIKEIVEDASF